ncbi:MAG TPA: hypothetical protein VK858_13475 [Longimicrobiales bacterium]|nr:hypothetical protein [Longimicrobiales bacterium]
MKAGEREALPITAADFEIAPGYVMWGLMPMVAVLAVTLTRGVLGDVLPNGMRGGLWILVPLVGYGAVAAAALPVARRSHPAEPVSPNWLLVIAMTAVALGVGVLSTVRAAYLDSFRYGYTMEWSVEFGALFDGLASLLPAFAFVVMRETAIRGIVVGQLERQLRSRGQIVSMSAFFDLMIAFASTVAGIFLGSGVLGDPATLLLEGTGWLVAVAIGVSLTLVRLGSGRLLPCIVVGFLVVLVGRIIV